MLFRNKLYKIYLDLIEGHIRGTTDCYVKFFYYLLQRKLVAASPETVVVVS